MFSSVFTTLFLVAVSSTLVHSAPTPALDAGTLLKNGQDAQKLNTFFQTIKETDSCTNEDKACISNGVAVCVQGKWKTSGGQCSASQKCFALPSTREAGTLVTCTSEKSALSAIEATGASGGLFGAAGANSTSTMDNEGGNSSSTISLAPTVSSSAAARATQTTSSDGDSADSTDECDDESDNEANVPPVATSSPVSEESPESTLTSSSMSSTTKSAEPTSISPDDNAGPITVTVTLTAQPTTFAPQTRTLSPEDASSVLSSLMANGATIIVSPSSSASKGIQEPIITPTPTPTARSSASALDQPATTSIALASASAMSPGDYGY